MSHWKPRLARWLVLPAIVVSCWLAASGLTTGARSAVQQDSVASSSKADDAKNADFAEAADEVLAKMSEITGLKLKSPLKKSLRSRDQIRAYVIQEMNEDKDEKERYAGARSAEAFGLLPKGFDVDSFMIDLLTEQIAGLYDPKAHEFYVADWIPIVDQREVMAHELTHALEDQHFHIEGWAKAARPNDDAELARESVLEGSAMAAMVDYLLKDAGHSLRDLPDFDPSAMVGDLAETPMLKKAPSFLKDALVFPYIDGLNFSSAFLKDGGWSALPAVFAKPPSTTQQIMHPELYRAGKVPAAMVLPSMEKALGNGWVKLEDNTMGEFGWKEVLKQFAGDSEAAPSAAWWDGDRYVVYEQRGTKRLLLITRVRFASEEQTAGFFRDYSKALQKKHEERSGVSRQANFLSFDTPDGGVFLRCKATECVTLEGGDRAAFASLNSLIHWDAAPEAPRTAMRSERELTGLVAADGSR